MITRNGRPTAVLAPPDEVSDIASAVEEVNHHGP
jgi:hypothetical protein